MEMIRTVLDNNVFGFGDKRYIQKEGVAIGSRLGKKICMRVYVQMGWTTTAI